MVFELQQESMDIDSPGGSKRNQYGLRDNGFDLYPVSANDSGEGLPYAPEDWPNPGDKWGWKVGRRIAASGYFLDRYMYLPRSLPQGPQGRTFASRLSLEQYIRANFPDVNIDAFFALFSWRIPSRLYKKDAKSMIESSMSTVKQPGSDNQISGVHCKAGNSVCISLASEENSVSEFMFCDMCCTEPGFCRDCCCILCCRTINGANSGYSFIKCEANIEGCICGHSCHVDCALRAYMAGTVGGSIGLDAEYYCRRCDSRTDLVSHVTKLLQSGGSNVSENDFEKILRIGICALRGSKKTGAQHLLRHMELAMSKVLEEKSR